MLSNAYFLAKFRFDTAENEPAKICNFFRFSKKCIFEKGLVRGDGAVRDGGESAPGPGQQRRAGSQRASVGKISAKCYSFSAVSAPIFARKYAFCSIFQNLPDSQAEIFEI